MTDVTLVAEDEIRCTAVVDENAAPSPDVSADVVFTQPSAGGGASATLAAGVTVKWGRSKS